MLTDTGYVSDRLAGIVENADAYLIESNHDIEILRAGSYSWNLKQRILSDKGHLCNEDGADAMIRPWQSDKADLSGASVQGKIISRSWLT